MEVKRKMKAQITDYQDLLLHLWGTYCKATESAKLPRSFSFEKYCELFISFEGLKK